MYLEQALGLLVEHFGIGPVRSAMSKVSNGAGRDPEPHPRDASKRPSQQTRQNVIDAIEQFRYSDARKYDLLSDFHARLKEKAVLPESQDIRHFSQLIGLKGIDGKSRKDMIARLMRALLERSSERLQIDFAAAPNVSEQQRKQGFSILTDKMLSGMDRAANAGERAP